jgi:2-aminoadipate transaminase
MFFWVRLPAGCDAIALLPHAVAAGVAFVPGAAFYARAPDLRTMRLSFVTLGGEQIEAGVAALGRLLGRAVDQQALASAA